MLALPLVQLSLLLRGAPQVGHRCGGPVCVAASPQVESFPLHEEAAAGDANGVELLLLSGIASDARNALSSTPLHLAAVHGHSAVATTLLDHGASINAVNEDGNTPLHAAVGRGNLELAQLLLSRGADPEVKSSSTGMQPLRIAVQKGDAAMVSALVAAGAVMDEETVHDAFWTAVQLVEEKPEDVPLSDAVPGLLRHVFDADIRLLLSRESVTTNVTCLQPAEDAPKTRADDDPGYGVIDDELVAVPLREGRVCDGGTCCDACSRVHYSQFATVAESDAFLSELQFAITPPLHQFSLQKCAFRDQRTTLIFIRLVERMRRAIAHEYGLALSSITPLQTFVSCFIGAQDKQGGLHSDESTFKEFHYSCVLCTETAAHGLNCLLWVGGGRGTGEEWGGVRTGGRGRVGGRGAE